MAENVFLDRRKRKCKAMRLPDYILDHEASPGNGGAPEVPKSPMIVFVNSKSGGQLGGQIIKSFRELLNPKQVYDLAVEKPEQILQKLMDHLEKLKDDGDKVATYIRNNLRIIVAGGDGTAGWLLGVMGDMKLDNPPPIATMPLGTGNNLPYSFGWGKKNPGTDTRAVRTFMKKVECATPIHVDSWHVTMYMAVDQVNDSLEPVKLPHSLHSFRRIDTNEQEKRITFRGGFWNYFSIGMDSQVAYEFHFERQQHPERFKNQFTNQTQYAKITCMQGWFCASCAHPRTKNTNHLAKIKVAGRGEGWQELDISSSIRSIVVLNLPSFSGGLNPWGTPSDNKSKERGLTEPFVDDGLLEVVGFRDAWHGAMLFAPNGHGVRLAQTHKLRVEFHSGAEKETYMRMDGEPWLQPLPESSEPTVLEITQLGQSYVLVTDKATAKSSSATPTSVPSSSSSDDDSGVKRKFGAAMTFRRSGEEE